MHNFTAFFSLDEQSGGRVYIKNMSAIRYPNPSYRVIDPSYTVIISLGRSLERLLEYYY